MVDAKIMEEHAQEYNLQSNLIYVPLIIQVIIILAVFYSYINQESMQIMKVLLVFSSLQHITKIFIE